MGLDLLLSGASACGSIIGAEDVSLYLLAASALRHGYLSSVVPASKAQVLLPTRFTQSDPLRGRGDWLSANSGLASYLPARYTRGMDSRTAKEIDARKRKRMWLARMKLEKGCSRCGYKRCARALQWHHKDRSTKTFNVSQMLTYRESRILAEIKKCDLICSNCHFEQQDAERIERERRSRAPVVRRI